MAKAVFGWMLTKWGGLILTLIVAIVIILIVMKLIGIDITTVFQT
jgi:hypothetical protein